MLKKNFKKQGFTLIELLVVIAVIGILSGVVINTSIKGAARSRDARRIQELYQIANALLQYYVVNGQYPDNTDSGDIGCWSNWDSGNIVNGKDDPFIKPLIDEGFLTFTPKEWKNLRDGWDSQCIYRYMRVENPCGGCTGWYAVLYGACESSHCPINERPACCTTWDEGAGSNDSKDITIFLKE